MKGVSGVGLSETMKALGDPVRREILNLLKGGRMTAGDIASRFDMTAATVSYHLAQLKKADSFLRAARRTLSTTASTPPFWRRCCCGYRI